jgi:hypothetical protein
MFIIFHFGRQIGPPNKLLSLLSFLRLRNHRSYPETSCPSSAFPTYS